MNANYISRALCFHGQPMQKIWEDERGAGDLQQCGIRQHPDYSIYQERQKFFTFQDRAKRLKLHQFFARKASDLYDAELTGAIMENAKLLETKPYVATLPPYEIFVNKIQDKIKRWRCVLEAIKPGDIVYGIITKTTTSTSAMPQMVNPLCTGEPLVRYLKDIPIKAYLLNVNALKPTLDKRGKARAFAVNDIVCCEVLENSVDADRLTLGVEGVVTKNKDVQLGLVSADDLPAYYRKIKDNVKYEEYLHNSKEFLNPNYDLLYEINGLNVNDTFTLMSSLKQSFPRAEYAKELRQTQASKWAFRSVAEGIEHFKNGHHVEAFQCLNKALNIDPRNVEGLVARGALFANKGSFLKAVDDFEKALKLNSYHVNARKYMGETLVALGRRYEEEKRIQDAAKAYKDCLNIIPNHEQARLSLEAIQQRTGGNYLDGLFNVAGATSDAGKSKEKKRDNSDASVSDDSSSDSSDSDTESEQSDAVRGRGKEASLSPLSKRMALHAATLELEESNKQFNQPFYMAAGYDAVTQVPTRNPNEFKLDEDDTESRVRKLLLEASKHKQEKSKKSKKKKSKKSKKNSKEKNATALLEKINFQEAYKAISGMNIENKLTENLQLYEKTIAEVKKRQELLHQSSSETSNTETAHRRQETPPPKPPSMRIQPDVDFYMMNARSANAFHPYASTSAAAGIPAKVEQPKLSFQIKRPVKIDKFGLVRIATPLAQKSPTRSRSRSPTREHRRHYRSRSRSHSPHGRRRSRHRSRSSSYESRHRRRRERHRSRSRTRSRSRQQRRHSPPPNRYSTRDGYKERGSVRRRTPSPFVPRNSSPTRRRSRSRDYGNNKRSSNTPAFNQRPTYGNRVWKRPDFAGSTTGSDERRSRSRSLSERWPHDKFKAEPNKLDDGPSIEEIDEIINKAQRERKLEIINRDKDILKKPPTGQF